MASDVRFFHNRPKRVVPSMGELLGRDVHIPRAVFARDIAHGSSREPPNGEYWLGKVTEYDPNDRGAPFTLLLIVYDNDTGEESTEEQCASLSQVRKWLAETSLLPHESRATVGEFRDPAKTPKTHTKPTTSRSKCVFASPSESQRYMHLH